MIQKLKIKTKNDAQMKNYIKNEKCHRNKKIKTFPIF